MTTYQNKAHKAEQGFTLIELSIVLVIIGLIVGGVLVGQDLIKAAEVRAQITQIEKYNTAVNTFRVKFNAIPGDMASATASQFGFTTGTGCDGTAAAKRDGNGLVDGVTTSATTYLNQGLGETGLFWADLSSSVGGNLVDGSFTTATAIGCATTGVSTAATGIGSFIPSGKLRGTNVYVFDGNATPNTTAASGTVGNNAAPGASGTTWSGSGYNWYGISSATAVTAAGALTTGTPITVIQAYNIDKKVDDGIPNTGNVMAVFINGATIASSNVITTSGGSTASCYDTASSTYSITKANGNGGNCALSFRFQ